MSGRFSHEDVQAIVAVFLQLKAVLNRIVEENPQVSDEASEEGTVSQVRNWASNISQEELVRRVQDSADRANATRRSGGHSSSTGGS